MQSVKSAPIGHPLPVCILLREHVRHAATVDVSETSMVVQHVTVSSSKRLPGGDCGH